MDREIKIFVGGSTDVNISENYKNTANKLGEKFNERNYKIVFDGCLGLPFLTYINLDYPHGSIIFKTRWYTTYINIAPGISIKEFDNQTEFINNIVKDSDAMIFMKGGPSTVAEIMHVIEAKKNKEHDKPIIILNINNEWDEIVNLLDSFNMNDIYYVTDNIIDGLNYLETKLFTGESYFSLFEKQFLSRKEPIIEDINYKTK